MSRRIPDKKAIDPASPQPRRRIRVVAGEHRDRLGRFNTLADCPKGYPSPYGGFITHRSDYIPDGYNHPLLR